MPPRLPVSDAPTTWTILPHESHNPTQHGLSSNAMARITSGLSSNTMARITSGCGANTAPAAPTGPDRLGVARRFVVGFAPLAAAVSGLSGPLAAAVGVRAHPPSAAMPLSLSLSLQRGAALSFPAIQMQAQPVCNKRLQQRPVATASGNNVCSTASCAGLPRGGDCSGAGARVLPW